MGMALYDTCTDGLALDTTPEDEQGIDPGIHGRRTSSWGGGDCFSGWLAGGKRLLAGCFLAAGSLYTDPDTFCAENQRGGRAR